MAKPYSHRLNYIEVVGQIEDLTAGELLLELPPTYRHWFAAVEFFDSGDQKVIPTAGTVDFLLRSATLPEDWQGFTDNSVEADTPEQVNWAANTVVVRAVFTSVTGATRARLRANGNIS